MKNYGDIINLPHHVSHKHPKMSMHNRAAQFAPFSALVGYGDAIDERARLTEDRRNLDEDEQLELNKRLSYLATRLKDQIEISIEYFVPDERKAGGKYKITSGYIKKISMSDRTIKMGDDIVHMDNIVAIAGAIFDNIDL